MYMHFEIVLKRPPGREKRKRKKKKKTYHEDLKAYVSLQ